MTSEHPAHAQVGRESLEGCAAELPLLIMMSWTLSVQDVLWLLLSWRCVLQPQAYQVPVQELLGFQVLHSFTDILAHLQQLGRLEPPPRFLQEVQEAAVGHVLSDDEDGMLLGADPIELHELLMRQVPVLGTRRAVLSI